MGTVTKRLIGALGAALVLAGLARRQHARGWSGGGWRGGGPPPAGVREPRRPVQPAGSAAAAATPPSD